MTAPALVPEPPPYSGFTRLEQSGLVTTVPAYIFGITITPDGTACDVALYNGQDDSPFGLFHTFHTGANATQGASIAGPLYFNRGIYLTLGAHAQEVTISWSPVPRELGEPQSPFPDEPEPSS